MKLKIFDNFDKKYQKNQWKNMQFYDDKNVNLIISSSEIHIFQWFWCEILSTQCQLFIFFVFGVW
jgi:hypothetical protein